MTEKVLNEIRAKYEEYRRQESEIRAKIQAQMQEAFEEEIRSHKIDFSRTLHEAYQNGVRIKDLRIATKQYGSGKWDDLWHAAEGAPQARPGRPPLTVAAPEREYQFDRSKRELTFVRGVGDWNWSGVDSDVDTILIPLDDSGRIAYTPGDNNSVTFGARNAKTIFNIIETEI